MKTPEEVIAKLEDAKNGIYSTAELESIWIPNKLLPEQYQDNRVGGSTLDRINRIYDAETLPNREFQQTQAEKAERLKKYIAEYDETGTITYDVNEYKLYRNEQAFASAMGLEGEDQSMCAMFIMGWCFGVGTTVGMYLLLKKEIRNDKD